MKKTMHCLTCGTDAAPKSHTRGSFFIELVAWLCFFVPGIIYSLWRLSTRKPVCSSCASITIVPSKSPAADAHRRAMQS